MEILAGIGVTTLIAIGVLLVGFWSAASVLHFRMNKDLFQMQRDWWRLEERINALEQRSKK